jgi:hypothetical protein
MRLRQAKVDEDGKKEERRKDRQERMPEYVWKVRGSQHVHLTSETLRAEGRYT